MDLGVTKRLHLGGLKLMNTEEGLLLPGGKRIRHMQGVGKVPAWLFVRLRPTARAGMFRSVGCEPEAGLKCRATVRGHCNAHIRDGK